MKMTTQDNFTEYTITQTLELVFGNTVRSEHIGTNMFAGLRSIFGGEARGYSKLLTTSRQDSITRMITEAKALGADGIVGIRFSTSSISQGMSEVIAYGTAVKLSNV